MLRVDGLILGQRASSSRRRIKTVANLLFRKRSGVREHHPVEEGLRLEHYVKLPTNIGQRASSSRRRIKTQEPFPSQSGKE